VLSFGAGRGIEPKGLVPVEVASEFVDGAACGVLEVEPVEGLTGWPSGLTGADSPCRGAWRSPKR
jgi:hypothetical protein